MPTAQEIIRNVKFGANTYEIGIGDTDMELLQDTFEDINDNFETLNQTIEDNELATSAALNTLNQNKADKTTVDSLLYASSATHAGPATKAVSIPSGVVDSTSTSTAYTAQIDGITELRDGVCAYIRNGIVTSATGCTLNVNGLGAKPIYQTLAAATAVTTAFNVNYTYLFIYNSTRVTGGCWDIYYGYNTNTTYTNASLGQGYGTCSTATATTAKTATLANYELRPGGFVAVKFDNDVPASATLSVNSKTATAIYYQGAAITDGVINAGDIATFVYDGTNYKLLCVDNQNIICGDY